MKTLKRNAPIETLDIEIGGTVVSAFIDATADNLLSLADACGKAEKEMGNISAMQRRAQAERDFPMLRKLNKGAADAMEPAIRTAIGDEAYDAVVKACGAGRAVPKESCNVVMVKILEAIAETVREQQIVEEGKAAHYLAEVEDAQTEPYTMQ